LSYGCPRGVLSFELSVDANNSGLRTQNLRGVADVLSE
jgi:hypothetical protein